jgi:hypothetical protein
MAYYDIGEAFQLIEEEMIASMARNLKRHLKTEKDEGLNYTMWQAEQLAALQNFKKDNKKHFSSYFSTINQQIEDVLKKANETGLMTQEVNILEAIKGGFKLYDYESKDSIRGQFFKINERKLNALIKATKSDMAKAETAMLRTANDEYRKIIFNAETFYNTGAGTLAQCVDMATHNFLAKGITCIEYANGARVGIDVYSRMALRTAQTRAYLAGEATKRDEWGVNTVIVNKRGVACPMCLKWVGKVYYDDVWGNSPVPAVPKYPRLSEAVAGGLYHPNCKDIHTTYFEGVSSKPEPMTQKQVDEANRVYALEQQQRYNERQIRKYKRLWSGSADPENALRYKEKTREWQARQKEFVAANDDVLKRRPELEKIFRLPDDLRFGHNSYDPSQDVDDIIKENLCADGHTWIEEIIDYPTCVDKGVKIKRCSVCGEEGKEIDIPATGHKWIDAGITKQPKCEEPGEKLLRCEYCGKEETEEIPATGHDIRSTVYDPTCTGEGYTIEWCTRCHHRKKTDIKPALGHDWGDWVITRQPTTALYGRKQAICKRCGEKKYTTIPKLKANSTTQQIKALEDSISQLDNEIAALNQNSYSGIWKDSVTVSDYSIKKSVIGAKKQYFLDQIAAGDTSKDWQQLIDLTDEFELKGKEYETLLAQRQKNQDAIDLLRPPSTTGPFTSDAYSKARKDAALWSTDKRYIDSKIRKKSGDVWRNSTTAQKDAAYKYTSGSGSFNRPLRGYRGSWYDYVGPGNVDLDYEGSGAAIDHLTKMIDKSSYDFDVWLNRGVETDGAASFLGISPSDMFKSQAELEKMLLGTVKEDLAFMSTGAAKGAGFSGHVFNIYAPKGTKMLYCEPFSAYSGDGGSSWDGLYQQSWFGSEFEMLIQRGTKFKIIKVEKQGSQLYIDMEVVSQI